MFRPPSKVMVTTLALIMASLVSPLTASDAPQQPAIERSFVPLPSEYGGRGSPVARNPSIHVGGELFHIVWMTGDVKFVRLDQLITELAALPTWAWPEGRVVQLQRPGLHRRERGPLIEANLRAAKDLLEKHGYIVRLSAVSA